MRAKYFFAKNIEAAIAEAAGYFNCDEASVTFDVIREDEEANFCQLLAITGEPGEVANMDAHYTVYYDTDGVYLELYKERGSGYSFKIDDMMSHLSRKKIRSLDLSAVQTIIKNTQGRIKIAGPQTEYTYGEDMDVVIAGDESKASATLLAPESGGSLLDVDTAKQMLKNNGVIHGIDEKALANLLETKDYGRSFVVATATLPENGDNGKLIFNFSTDERTGSPKEISHGRVNYRLLDLYVAVEEGQLLVTRVLATGGIPGTSVRGSAIAPKPGKEVALPKGKNVEVNEDKTEMFAKCSGMVVFVNNCVCVSNVYEVRGDCDLSVGDIDFDGSVHVHGSVRTGSTVKATGSVIVDGSVEAATIIAGGNVEVKGGMQGADKGRIEACGAVTILYVERGTVHADGPVTLDVSMHSYIESGDSLVAKGRRGAIIGGHAGSCGNIIANYVGALSHTRTEVSVGATPRKRARLKFLEDEIEKLAGQQVDLDKVDKYLKKSKSTMPTEKWQQLYKSCLENRKQNTEILNDYIDETNILKYELEHATDGKIHVFNTVFSGARMLIGSETFAVNDEISYVSFKYNDSQVVYGPCEIPKS